MKASDLKKEVNISGYWVMNTEGHITKCGDKRMVTVGEIIEGMAIINRKEETRL